MNIQLDHTSHQNKHRKTGISIFLNQLSDPLNIGSAFRLADALAVDKIYIGGESPTPPHRKIKKTSRSTEDYVQWEHVPNQISYLESLKKEGFKLVGIEICSNSIDIRHFEQKLEDNLCLILGNEIHGIQEEILELCDTCLHIPMIGNNSSMNVSNALAIALFELSRKRI